MSREVGCRVIWADPEGTCSGSGTIAHKSEPDDDGTDDDTIYGVWKDDGGYVEAYGHELSTPAERI